MVSVDSIATRAYNYTDTNIYAVFQKQTSLFAR